MSERIAIIAALEREIAPLLLDLEAAGKLWELPEAKPERDHLLSPAAHWYVSGDVLIISAGIGKDAAARAARAAVEFHRPTLLVSSGFAGSVTPKMIVADIIRPCKVIDATTGREFATDSSRLTTLVTASSVLSRDTKSALAARFSADAVDMEAAAVAAVAENAGIRFAAIKAISDPFDFDMPPLDRFIDSAGKLNLLELLVYAAVRPRLWGVLARLRRNSARAAEALARALVKLPAGDPLPAK